MDLANTDLFMEPSPNLYQSLVQTIATQQISGHSARAISKRFEQLYANGYPKPSDVTNTPDRLMRKAGLSIGKIRCIKDVSELIEDGVIPIDRFDDLPDEEIRSMLMQVKGIGRWTVDIFMMFGMARPDVMPAGDLGIRKGIQQFYSFLGMPSEDEVDEIARKWSPYRTAAAMYIWMAQR